MVGQFRVGSPQIDVFLLLHLYSVLHGIFGPRKQRSGFREGGQRIFVARHRSAGLRQSAGSGGSGGGGNGWGAPVRAEPKRPGHGHDVAINKKQDKNLAKSY